MHDRIGSRGLICIYSVAVPRFFLFFAVVTNLTDRERGARVKPCELKRNFANPFRRRMFAFASSQRDHRALLCALRCHVAVG